MDHAILHGILISFRQEFLLVVNRSTGIIFVLLALLASYSLNLLAQSSPTNKNFQSTLLPTRQNAAHKVKKQTGGRILDVKKQSSVSGGPVWRVKFLKDGRIQFMDVAPQASTE